VTCVTLKVPPLLEVIAMALDQAISELAQTLDQNPAAPQWRRLVRLRLAAVREALAEESVRFRDGWLSARGSVTEKDRRQWIDRVSALTPRLSARSEPDTSYADTRRLAADLEHYRQRLHDLVYDSVGIELGGSE
jgi:hypothetical protein